MNTGYRLLMTLGVALGVGAIAGAVVENASEHVAAATHDHSLDGLHQIERRALVMAGMVSLGTIGLAVLGGRRMPDTELSP